MKRVIPVVMICLFVSAINTSVQAQNKIGYISLQELIPAMPEYKKAETELADYGKALNDLLIQYRNEYDAKDSIYKVDSANWNPSMRTVKKQELIELAMKVYNFQQDASKKMQQKENDLLAPIQQKAVSTTQAVAKENGYAYVLSKEQLISFPASDDMLPLVAKKMGIKIESPTAAAPPKPTGK